ncbi:hypothetical protein [Flagellimonas flava]|uniref:Uncharacterized protein n=1 Tax=Flagellimonas flava TaxID=570519 RepID=A0A1M5L2E6_9FLAO|nr:hypothetical protein [Allomuricauda flava]SHG58593.1 hypothetical protein SAMN04488116_1891 [Allomuricauda flava]
MGKAEEIGNDRDERKKIIDERKGGILKSFEAQSFADQVHSEKEALVDEFLDEVYLGNYMK